MLEKKISDLESIIRKDPLINQAKEIAEELKSQLFLVGGWLRDRLMGLSSQDYDFILDGDVTAFAGKLSKKLKAPFFSMGHGKPPNYRIVGPAFTIDIVPQYPQGFEKELSRRDFTINTITYSFSEKKLHDPLGGLRDLEDQTVRMVSPKVLDQDPLRMIRAVRFMTTLQDFHLSEETATEIRKMPERLSDSAVERVREEMDRVMVSGLARKGLLLMEDLGLLRFIFPELLPLRGMDQGPHHHLDAFQHTLQAVREVDNIDSLTGPFEYSFKLDTEDRLVLSYSALLHDIGKAEDRTEDEAGIPHFYGHEKTGVEMARRIMKRLTFPNRRAERINRLIRYHVSGLGLIQNGYTQKALRRILLRLGEDLPLHVLLFLADRRAAQGSAYQEKEERTIALGQALLDLYQEQGESILNLPNLIGGEDVMEVLEIPPGPAVGAVIDQVRSLQVDQVIRTREEALQYLQKLLEAKELDS